MGNYGRWKFNEDIGEWSNICDKCCLACESSEQCFDNCGKVFTSESGCLGCRYDN